MPAVSSPAMIKTANRNHRLPAVDALLKEMMTRGVTFVLHAGDYCSPFSLKPFQDHGIAMAGVFGKNDGDPEGIRAFAAQGMGQELFESPHSLNLGDLMKACSELSQWEFHLTVAALRIEGGTGSPVNPIALL